MFVIFDCDGVLVDSENLAAEIFTDFLNGLGFVTSVAETHSRYRGKSAAYCKAEFAERLQQLSNLSVSSDVEKRVVGEGGGINFAALADFYWQEVQKLLFKAFETRLKSVPNVVDVLDWLGEENINFCVASSGDHKKMSVTLRVTELQSYFEGKIFSAEDVGRGKPEPDLFLYAAKTFNVNPAEVVVIEDSLPGVQAGLAAGMRVLAFVAEADLTQQKQFAELGALCFSSMRQLPGLLRQQ